jgi:hypothetical protein
LIVSVELKKRRSVLYAGVRGFGKSGGEIDAPRQWPVAYSVRARQSSGRGSE